jgi:AcrR family transcriptional regulator
MTDVVATIKNPEKIRKKHDKITDAAISLIKKKGFNKTTLRDISKKTNTSLGNLYAYIRSKDDVLFLVHDRATKILSESIEKGNWEGLGPEEKLCKMIGVEFDCKEACQDLVMIIYQESHELSKPALRKITSREEERVSIFEFVIKEGIADGVFRSVNPSIAAHFIIALVDGWILRRWSIRSKTGSRKMKREIEEVILRYVRAGEV